MKVSTYVFRKYYIKQVSVNDMLLWIYMKALVNVWVCIYSFNNFDLNRAGSRPRCNNLRHCPADTCTRTPMGNRSRLAPALFPSLKKVYNKWHQYFVTYHKWIVRRVCIRIIYCWCSLRPWVSRARCKHHIIFNARLVQLLLWRLSLIIFSTGHSIDQMLFLLLQRDVTTRCYLIFWVIR